LNARSFSLLIADAAVSSDDCGGLLEAFDDWLTVAFGCSWLTEALFLGNWFFAIVLGCAVYFGFRLEFDFWLSGLEIPRV
jgi:hypothetical protein